LTFLVAALKTKAANAAETVSLKQSKAIDRAEPGRWIFQPGHLTWRALV